MLAFLALAVLGWIAVGGSRRVWFSPFSKFPGPKPAWLSLRNEFCWDVMHQQYYPIVRINPFEIHILDPDCYQEPYASNRKLDKYKWWTEPLIKSNVEKMSARFGHLVEAQGVVRLNAAFMALAMNITCDYAFARDRRCLDELDFKPEPILLGEESSTSSRMIFHEPLKSGLPPPEENTLQRLCDEGDILTGAGSETTAQMITRLFFCLKHEPQTLEQLREELDQAIPNPASASPWAVLQALPYLCRDTRSNSPLSRSSHPSPTNRARGHQAGTPISQTTYFILTHPDVFPEPHTFRPERWLQGDKLGKALEQVFGSFWEGFRAILAYAEMYLAVVTLVRRFYWEMYETALDGIVCKRDFFVAVDDLDSKGVRARIVARRM
ncbi:cytochrome P450 [Immersiella caudata]|uniref:Cytochrome P450 n=1 Tax=Immersiella caudata TaxID=314043 RepID=A0AA39XI35_9PEZI|nr:cytochrome P450 [Immersiella caudata]